MAPPLKHPPVYFTLAQARFNPLLKLGEYLPQIQDGLRKAGYPAFSTHSSIAVQVVAQDGQFLPRPVAHEHFVFANAAQTHSFVLSTDALTFQSTNYGSYEQFSSAFLSGLDLVHAAVALDFTERVGLRYLDHVFPEGTDTLSQYLAPEVQGLSGHLGGTPVHAYTEAFNLVGDVQLRARVVIQDGALAFPPDLLPRNMVVQPRFMLHRGMHAVLDTDGATEGRSLFSVETVKDQLHTIHQVIGDAFRATVTAHALDTWNRP